jgi:hypothetical protein
MTANQHSVPIVRRYGFDTLTQVAMYMPAALLLLAWMIGFAGGWIFTLWPAIILISLSIACVMLIWFVTSWTLTLSSAALIVTIGPYQRTIPWDTVIEVWQYGKRQLEIVPRTGRSFVIPINILDQPDALVRDIQPFVVPDHWYTTSALIRRPMMIWWVIIAIGLAQIAAGQGVGSSTMVPILALIAGFSLAAEGIPWIFLRMPHTERFLIGLEGSCYIAAVGSWYIATRILQIDESIGAAAQTTAEGLFLLIICGPNLILRPLLNRRYQHQARQQRRVSIGVSS